MPVSHTVKQGEHLSKICDKYGFADYRTVWDHPDNAELKRKRENPNILYPGDKLVIPDKQSQQESGATEQRHQFRLNRHPLMLRLVIRDQDGEPITDTECTLQVDGKEYELTTDGDGRIEQEITPRAESGVLTILGVEMPVEIGHLDPVEEHSGQEDRLDNLGYAATGGNAGDGEKFLSAVEEFQCDHDLTVDGICGSKTQAKLLEVHGC